MCRLLPAFFNRGVHGFPTTNAPPLSIPLDTTHNGCVVLPAQLQFRLILVPPVYEPFGCSENLPVPLAGLFCRNGPHRGFSSKHQRNMFRGPGLEHSEVVNYVGVYARSSIVRPVSGPPHRSSSRTSPDWVVAPPFAASRHSQRRVGGSSRCSRIVS